jgi:hypothetical protein
VARRLVEEVECDSDGSTEDVQTVTITLDGETKEVDLCVACAGKRTVREAWELGHKGASRGRQSTKHRVEPIDWTPPDGD